MNYLHRLNRVLIEGTADPSAAWSDADWQLTSANFEVEEDRWDDPGDYPSGAGGGRMASRQFVADVRGAVVITLGERAVQEFTEWMEAGGDLPAVLVQAANEAANDEAPGVRVRHWEWKLDGNKLHLHPGDFEAIG